MVVGGAIEPLCHFTLDWSVPKGVHDVVHGGKLTLAPPLSPLTQLVPVVLDLRLVSQRHLQDQTGPERQRQTGLKSSPSLQLVLLLSHLCVDLLCEGGA